MLEFHDTTLSSARLHCRWCDLRSTRPVAALMPELSGGRPNPSDRRFSSPVIESVIRDVTRIITDPTLRTMFERCFPNTLGTTVFPGTQDGKPDTFVITGDIDATWLQDSSAQISPYLRFVKRYKRLADLLEGVVRRHARSILIDPFAASCRGALSKCRTDDFRRQS
jgi:meiotically up-regulated gene 157 (Mug157) protein